MFNIDPGLACIICNFATTMSTIIEGHNAKVPNPTTPFNNPKQLEKTCNCRNKENCLKNYIYQATVTTANQNATYFGSCSTSFKARYNNHTPRSGTRKKPPTVNVQNVFGTTKIFIYLKQSLQY